MALSGTDRGAGSTNTGGQSTLVATPASNCTAGAMLALVVAYDNSGASGADPFNTITDSKGNTWTSRIASLRTPGTTANDGLAGRIFTTSQNVGALGTGDTITVDFNSVNTLVRSWNLIEVSSDIGAAEYGSSGQEVSSATSPTITTGTLASGNLVIGAFGREGNDSITDDTDSTNSALAWSTSQSAGSGSGNTGGQVMSQWKVVNAAATQTFNVTFGNARDCVEMWISFKEAVIVTPSTLALTTTRFAPTVSAPRLCTPGTRALSTTRYAPVIGLAVIPGTRALSLSTFAPTVAAPRLCTPGTLSLALTTFAPTAAAPRLVTPGTLSLVTTGFAPTVAAPRLVTPGTLALILSGFAPTVTAGSGGPVTCTPGTVALVLASFAPTILTPRLCTPGTRALSLTGFAPTVSAPRLCTPGTLALILSTFAPTVTGFGGAPVLVTPGTLALALSTFPPTVGVWPAGDGCTHRSLSTAARLAIHAAQTGEVFCFLVTLTHGSFVEPIRVCSGGVDLTSRGLLFTAYPFMISMPTESDEAPPSVQLAIDNADRSIVTAVREVSTPIAVTLELVLGSSPDTLEAGPFDFTLRDVEYDASTVSGQLSYEDILNEPYPADSFTRSRTPGVF